MLRILIPFAGLFALTINLSALPADWSPSSVISREEILSDSQTILTMPTLPLRVEEDIFRIRALEMDWDMGAMVYEPEDISRIPTGPDGNKIGVFILHGGASDHRSRDELARMLAGKFGFKVVSMSYPGRLYLLDASRNWPGDTINPDGTVRMPIWNKDKLITPDQYEVVEDKSMMDRYGTVILACAKEDTEFYHRMAGWPVAFEEAGKDLMRRHLPEGEYSIYIHGGSTGGPFSFMLTQRVPNITGVLGMENSPFGYIYSRLIGYKWENPFQCLTIFTWRLRAMYQGAEILKTEGPEALKRLPMLMEDVFAIWQRGTTSPQFKAEYPVHLNGVEALTEAARDTARRLNLSGDKTDQLVNQYLGYARELSGEGVKPVPPVLYSISKYSKDHTYEGYSQTVLPAFAAMEPAPKVTLTQFDAGYHGWTRPEEGLPMGVAPAVVKMWHDAIMGGYFEEYSRQWVK
ncbi:MAG: hypothetical protein VYA53_03145 [Acidobacteriota bacterium]|nr:hypothetical protein [Acidobacteriota bacterium]